MKFENQNLQTIQKADKYLGFVEPEISEILKDKILLSLIKSDGIAVDKLISTIKSHKIKRY